MSGRVVFFVKESLANTYPLDVGTRQVIIEENTFRQEWLNGVSARDILIVVVDIKHNSRVAAEDDGRYYELFNALRDFDYVFAVTQGKRDLISRQGAARNVIKVFNYESMGHDPFEELIAKVRLEALHREVGTRGRSSLGVSVVFNALAVLFFTSLIVFAYVSPCSNNNVSERVTMTQFAGVLNVPDAIPPQCNNTNELQSVRAEMKNAFDLIIKMIDEPDGPPVNNVLEYVKKIIEVASSSFYLAMDNSMACEELHKAYISAVAEFQLMAQDLYIGQSLETPRQCITIGKMEYRFPKWLSQYI